jgi:hypothetical protein
LDKIAEFEYPTLGTFDEAMKIAQEALLKHDGVIPVVEALRKIDLKPSSPANISGSYYHKLDDLTYFGLFRRESGVLRTLPIAEKACHPHDSAAASQGKGEAIRNNLPLVNKLYDAWQGELPEESALPAKLEKTLGVSWQEARKHSKKLRKLLLDTFPYLSPYAGPELVETNPAGDAEVMIPIKQQASSLTEPVVRPYGEVRTTIGSIVIRNQRQLKLARDLLDELERQFESENKLEEQS